MDWWVLLFAGATPVPFRTTHFPLGYLVGSSPEEEEEAEEEEVFVGRTKPFERHPPPELLNFKRLARGAPFTPRAGSHRPGARRVEEIPARRRRDGRQSGEVCCTATSGNRNQRSSSFGRSSELHGAGDLGGKMTV